MADDKKLDDAFRAGFVTGWYECVGSKEPDKLKLREIAKAGMENYMRDLPPADLSKIIGAGGPLRKDQNSH